MSGPIIEVQGLTKTYKSYSKPHFRLLELLSGNRIQRHMLRHALKDVSFELMPGDRLGIMGENGSGKSTLLKILSSVLTPTSGFVNVKGKVAALLELGSGFHPELSGRENVFQHGYIMGYSEAQIRERFPIIADFSEIGEAIDYPVKGYSSGMLMRLAFAASVFVEPDILIIDEALTVGDAYFQTKCFYKIKSLIEKGTTFLYVSHGQDSVRTLCNKAIVLEEGKIIISGCSATVADFYIGLIRQKSTLNSLVPLEEKEKSLLPVERETSPQKENEANLKFSQSIEFSRRVSGQRQGTGYARITDMQVLNDEKQVTQVVDIGELTTVRVFFETYREIDAAFDVGIGVCDTNGVIILQSSTYNVGYSFSSPEESKRYCVDFRFVNILAPGQYNVIAGLSDLLVGSFTKSKPTIGKLHDVCYGGLTFTVRNLDEKPIWGKVDHPFDISVNEI